MKLLYVTTYKPEDSIRGGASWVDRTILAELEANFDTEVFTAIPPLQEDIAQFKLRAAATFGAMIINGSPYERAKFEWQSQWKKSLAAVQRASQRADVVVSSQWVGLLLATRADVQVATHIAHNVDAVNAREYGGALLKLFRNHHRMATAERRMLLQPASIVALSTIDTRRISRIRNGVTHLSLTNGFRNDRRGPAGRSIGFLGTMRWGPNTRAYNELVQLLHAYNRGPRNQHIKLRVAGRYSDELPAAPDVERIGPVRDPASFYESVDLIVVPRFGQSTGISVKVLEAMEHGVQVVCPSTLARAIGTRDVLIADSPTETISQIAAFFDDLPSDQLPTGPEQIYLPTETTVSLTQLAQLVQRPCFGGRGARERV